MPIEPLKYITLNDFTPGIWAGGLNSGLNQVSNIPAPIGAAQEEDTWGCIAAPSGGLVPLPGGTFGSLPTPEATPASGGFVVNGIRAIPTGLHFGITWLENATNNEKFRWYRDGGATVVVTHTGNAYTPSTWLPQAFTTGVTRLTSAGAIANISVVGAWADRLGGGGKLWYFPDPAAPGVDAPAADAAHTGQLFAHQGRILCFTPSTVAHGLTGNNTTTNNELIQYTDPAQSATMGTQNTLLSPESPFGYGCWGSISAGELLLIKFSGGGLMMYEDIVYPRVVRLPGLAGTNGYMQQGSFCSAGLVYLSKDNGAYVWNGNNTSQKISPQLDPSSFAPAQPAGYTRGHPSGFGANPLLAHTTWLDRVVFPNNWMYDPTLNSWWKITSNIIKYTWWASYGTKLYGLPEFYSSGPNQMVTFDTNLCVGGYTWKSQPITAAVPPKTFSIREVELIAQAGSSIVGPGQTVVITLTSPDSSAVSLTYTLQGYSSPEKIVKQLDTPMVCSNVTVKLEAASNAVPFPAPSIHAVNIGFGEDRSGSTPFS